ncbi:MAG: response regulator transcription factor [Bacteroidota bacterium]|nr:MAG: response regulator transcription factor [Bacteroidota bacterium]
MKIYLVDDNDTFRANLKLYLEGHLNYQVIGETDSGRVFLDATNVSADVVLMDINMPELNGVDTTKFSTWQNRNLKIIAVSQYKENVDLQQLIGAGFKGFVSKTNLFSDLDRAIKTVAEGGYFFPEGIKISF